MKNPASTILSTPYKSTAIYYADSDSVEYIREDVLAVHDRVDSFLTLIYDMKNRDRLIGFCLKGFKHFYLKDNVHSDVGGDFISGVQVIERALTRLGDQVFDEQRKSAYTRAMRMALDDRVAIQA
jgi:hypothetical protein